MFEGGKTRYGMNFRRGMSDADIEISMIRRGGQWVGKSGQAVGNGMFFHFQRLEMLLWPKEKIWHRWNELQLREYLTHRTIGILGPSSSGKTNGAATDVLADYYCYPECTTVLICSTTTERLQDRIFGEIKKYHRLAKKVQPELPGHLIEGRLRVVTDPMKHDGEGRDFRNGICFPSGTLVDTPNGPEQIENIESGDVVLNATGTGCVTRTRKSKSLVLVRVKLNDGRIIDCTPEHPFLTDKGWKKAVDLETLDMVFSACETLQIMRQPFTSRLSKPKILQRLLSELPSTKAVQTVRKDVRSLEPAPSLETSGEIGVVLQHCLRWQMGSVPLGEGIFPDSNLQALPEGNEERPFWKKVLLTSLPAAVPGAAVPSVREVIRFNHGVPIETQNPFLWEVLSSEMDWSKVRPEKLHEANPGGVDGMEAVPGISLEPSPENGASDEGWKTKLGEAGCGVPRTETGRGNRRWSSSHTSKGQERHCPNQNPGGAWVDSVEVLEPSGDGRFDKSEGGYTVHNLEVEGHPSYSVNGVIVHNCGVPFKRGGNFQGLEDFIGIKNKRMRMVADELQMLPSSFMMAISNLDKNTDLKVIGLGNPKETTDALGCFCEPAFKLGGWDGGIDQVPETKTWETRRPDGICIQFVGTDSPNLDGKLGIPLITQEAIDRDIAQYGRDSLQFTMMNMGMMPRGQGSRRVITRQLCMKNRALDAPDWLNGDRIRIGALDAAYGGVGGDRCIFMELQVGYEAEPIDLQESLFNIVSQKPNSSRHRQIVALVELMLVPINVTIDVEATEQIVNFCQSQCVTRNIPPQNFFFDSGMRTALVSTFARLWSPQTNPIDCGGSPSDRQVSAQIEMLANKYYSKFITELWFSVRLSIESTQFRGMKEAVMSEGCAREWKMVGANRIEVETKLEMKQKIGRSPDCFDCLAIGLEGARRLGFVINSLPSKGHREQDSAWKQIVRERASKAWMEGVLEDRA